MERVVLVDDAGNSVGTEDKAAVHHHETPLHLAFSAYVFNGAGEFLLTRRAASKKTWPAVWTNSCCGHPLPNEDVPGAIARRMRDEIGLDAGSVDLVLPRFRYRAEMPNGIVENELCPVYRVWAEGEPRPDPGEVAQARWIPWQDFLSRALSRELPVSPWCRQQLAELAQLGSDPARWRVASQDRLPPAARAPVP